MKKYLIIFCFSLCAQSLFAQSTYEELSACWRNNERMQALVGSQVEGFRQIQQNIYHAVQSLIRDEGITQDRGVPVFQNLHSVTRVAQELASLDSIYEAYFVEAVRVVGIQCVQQQWCVAKMAAELYRDHLSSYLEEEVFQLTDHYASELFAKAVGFRSARQAVNEQVAAWLSQDNEELSGEDPALNQPLTMDHFWSVLNADWDIELRAPETELLQAPSLAYAKQEFAIDEMAKKDKGKMKELLLFIFDNWKEIKDILNWLGENVFYDCKATSSARFKSSEEIDAAINNGLRRKAKYLVLQRGVLFDGRQTKTSLKGVVRMYKKKRIGWAKDRTAPVGIGYCTTQYNACENISWPADGSVYLQAPTLCNFKAAQHQVHPYALAIRDNASQYLTYYLYYKDHLFKTIYLFGSGNCM